MPGTERAVGKLFSNVATDNGRDIRRAHSPIGEKVYSCGLPTFSNVLFVGLGLMAVNLAYLLSAHPIFKINS
jgi:hypothetical protein